MNRIENVATDKGETQCPLRDEALEAVNGGTIRATGGPDTRPQAMETVTIVSEHIQRVSV